MPVNKTALLGALIGLIAAGSMGMKVYNERKIAAPQSRAAVEAFEKQVSSLTEYQRQKITSEAGIIDEKGRLTPLSDFKGKPVILNLWATWCAPCVSELPSLAKLGKSRPDLKVVAISQDLKKTPDELKAFLSGHQAESLDVYASKTTMLKKALPYNGLPTTYILSSKGEILYKIEGDTDWSSQIALDFLDYMTRVQDE